MKKIPLRKCVGCMEMKEKTSLIRVVRSPEGEIFIDKTGKHNGRGAYLCAGKECLKTAQKKKSLERSFKAPVSKEVYERLAEEAEGG